MHILLFADSTVNTAPLAESIRDHFGRRGIATWNTQMKKPVRDMMAAVNVIASRYGIEYPVDGLIADELYDHARRIDREIWHNAATITIGNVTKDWKKQNIPFITVIDDCSSLDEINLFKPGFSVSLTSADKDSPLHCSEGIKQGACVNYPANFHASLCVADTPVEDLTKVIAGLYQDKIDQAFRD